MSFFWDVLRGFLFAIDSIIYEFIIKIYNLFMEIANTTIFSDDIIDIFLGKVYALLGIFMLFKVSFSLLSYIANPDQFVDKNKGLNKIVVTVITSLALIVFTPYIFKQAMDLQRIILKENTIPKLFVTDANITTPLDGGEDMALTTFQAFFTNQDDTRITVDHMSEIFEYDVNKKDSDGNYVFRYTFVISTIAGIVELLLLINFCFDIAIRSVKLGFLRMVAPIPIIARIDPKKGTETFNKWTKLCINTYLDLFIRLIAVYFAIFIISQVTNNFSIVDAVTGQETEVSLLAIVFIIMGALLFAKQLPKLLEDLLGVKLSGDFTLNPLKKLASVPVAGNLTSRTLGVAGALMTHNSVKKGWMNGGKNVSFLGSDKKNVAGAAMDFFSENRKKRLEASDARMKYNEKHKLGENLYKEYPTNEENMFSNKEYKASYKRVKDAKDKRNALSSQLSRFKAITQDRALTAEEANYKDKLEVDLAKAESRLKIAESEHDKLKRTEQNIKNAEKEEAYDMTKKFHEIETGSNKPIEEPPINLTNNTLNSINNANNTVTRSSNNPNGGNNNSQNGSNGGNSNSQNRPNGGNNNSQNGSNGGNNSSQNRPNGGNNNSQNGSNGGNNNSQNGSNDGNNSSQNGSNGGNNSSQDNSSYNDNYSNGYDSNYADSSNENGYSQSSQVSEETRKQQVQIVEQLKHGYDESQEQLKRAYNVVMSEKGNAAISEIQRNMNEKIYRDLLNENEAKRQELERAEDELEKIDSVIRVSSPENYSNFSDKINSSNEEKIKKAVAQALEQRGKDGIYRFKSSKVDDTIDNIARMLMIYKENNIRAITRFNGIELDNVKFNSMYEINRYYLSEINNR